MGFLDREKSVCAAPISNAILWTHFVTPRGDQTQHDQTKQLSYHKKEESEELKDNSSHSGPVGLCTSMWGRIANGTWGGRLMCEG
jgi:hypothetical protein